MTFHGIAVFLLLRVDSMKIVRGHRRVGNRQRLDPLRFHRNHIVLILQFPLNQQKLLMHHHHVILSNSFGLIIALAIPVSSSMLKNTNPFAVPGLCRAITPPGNAHVMPSGKSANSAAQRIPIFRSSAR